MSDASAAPRVDFYVLESADARTRLNYACRLVEKAYLAGQTLYIAVDDDAALEALDEYLWTYSERSFVPHERLGAGDAPVLLGVGVPAPASARVLVNLAAEPPSRFADFERVAEFVDADAGRRDQGRRRFAFYRDHGIRAQTHHVGGDAVRG